MSEILYRGAGRFVTMRGSDQIVQFYELPEHMLRSSSDLHEILLYRSFRRALRDDQVQEMSVEALSFYFYAATFLHEALARQEGAPVRVIHHNEELGLLCEGLKLVTALRKIDWDIQYRGLFTNTTDEDGFDILHVLCDSLPSTVRIVGAKDSEEMPVDSDRVTNVWDYFKTPNVALSQMMDDLSACVGRGEQGFVIARVMNGAEKTVTDVYEREFVLPSRDALIDACRQSGFAGSFESLSGFDRDFLLPFDGDYSVALLHVGPAGMMPLLVGGLRSINDDAERNSRDLVVASKVEAPANYDSLFDFELQSLQDIAEPDWRAWCRDDDGVDLASVSWGGGVHGADALVTALYPLPPVAQLDEIVRNVAILDRDRGWLGVRGLAQTFGILRPSHPQDATRAIVHALSIARHHPTTVEYVRRFIRSCFPDKTDWTELTGRFSDTTRSILIDFGLQGAVRDLVAVGLIDGMVDWDQFTEIINDEFQAEPALLAAAMECLGKARLGNSRLG